MTASFTGRITLRYIVRKRGLASKESCELGVAYRMEDMSLVVDPLADDAAAPNT